MSAKHDLAPDAKVCINCRYLSFTPGADLRCADPASLDFDRAVHARATCARFQMSFAAVKLVAFRNGGAFKEPWQAAMHHHLAARLDS